MNILIPASPGGERAGEPSYTIVRRKDLNDTDWETMWNKFRDPNKGMRMVFNQDEALRFISSGTIDNVWLGNISFATELLGATAQTFVDADHETMVKLLGKFTPSAHPAFKDNSPVGTISLTQLSSVLDSMLRAKAEQTRIEALLSRNEALGNKYNALRSKNKS